MADYTYIFGQNTDIEWMGHITTVDEKTRKRYDYYAFFEDRAKADTYVKGIVALMPERNVVIRTTKVECYDDLDVLKIY